MSEEKPAKTAEEILAYLKEEIDNVCHDFDDKHEFFKGYSTGITDTLEDVKTFVLGGYDGKTS